MQLYVIRHPPPAVEAGVCYGRTDLGLADSFALPNQAQALRAALPFALSEVTPVYASPLQRCRQLAEALYPAPRFDSRLQEMHFGDWEMQPWRTLPRADFDAWAADPLHWRPPGGETVAELAARVLDFVAHLHAQQTGQAVLVTHAGVIKALVGHARCLAVDEWIRLQVDYLEIVHIGLAVTDGVSH